MIFVARKREKDRICQIIMQDQDFCRRQVPSVFKHNPTSINQYEFGSASPSNWWRQPRLSEDTVLPFLQCIGRKFAHRLMEQLVEIQPRAEMQKSAA
jgi:hypothetical protein